MEEIDTPEKQLDDLKMTYRMFGGKSPLNCFLITKPNHLALFLQQHWTSFYKIQ